MRALARASLDDVLAAWSGLGYYARARNLHRAAKLVVERHGGRLPEEVDELRALPGMGDYMAAAVSAIAFGQRTLPMEANIRRVVSRLFATSSPGDFLDGVISPARPGDSIAALFDLGQIVCRPRNPACPACPLRARCRARREGSTADFPVRAAKAPLRPFFRCAAAVFSQDGRKLLLRRRAAGWLAGMWELPGEEADRISVARSRFRRVFPRAERRPVATLEQPIAGRRVRVEVYRVSRAAAAGGRWMTATEIEASAAPSLTKKIVRRISPARADRRTIHP